MGVISEQNSDSMAYGKDQDPRDGQKRSVAKRLENKAERAEIKEAEEQLTQALINVVRKLTMPTASVDDFREQALKTAENQYERIKFTDLSDRKRAAAALKEIEDRVLGKPKQAAELTGKDGAPIEQAVVINGFSREQLLDILADES